LRKNSFFACLRLAQRDTAAITGLFHNSLYRHRNDPICIKAFALAISRSVSMNIVFSTSQPSGTVTKPEATKEHSLDAVCVNQLPTPDSNRPNRGALWLTLLLFALASLLLFLIPAFIIRPFTHQSARGLSLAIAVKRIAPALTLVSLAAMALLAWRLWTASSKLLRASLVLALLLAAASAVMSRQNYFEWMFNPIAAAGFIPAADAHLSDKEMVMAVRIGPQARAYPILQMAYHHILNDTVNGEPIVVTY